MQERAAKDCADLRASRAGARTFHLARWRHAATVIARSAVPWRRVPRKGWSVKGVYFLADDAVLHWALAMLTSLRRYEPSLPVVWIPFGGSDRRLQTQLDRYNVALWDGTTPLTAWEDLGRPFYPQNAVGARLFRKLACFDGPLSEFVFLDCDLVLKRPLDWAFGALERSSRAAVFYDEGLSDVYADPQLCRDMVAAFGSRGWNTGFWASYRHVFTYERASVLASKALPLSHGFASTGEQPVVNFMFDVAHISTGSLRDHALCTDFPASLIVTDDERRCGNAPALHWAGRSRPSLFMPCSRIWLGTRLRSRRPGSLTALAAQLFLRPCIVRARVLRGYVTRRYSRPIAYLCRPFRHWLVRSLAFYAGREHAVKRSRRRQSGRAA